MTNVEHLRSYFPDSASYSTRGGKFTQTDGKEPSHEDPTSRMVIGAVAVIFAAVAIAGCGGAAPVENKATADEVTAIWAKAFNTGDASGLAALYADDARSTPPGGSPAAGRSQIESVWRNDMKSGEVTKLTTSGSIAQGNLLHIIGSYDVAAKDGVTVAKGQYEQLWKQDNGQWKVQSEMWRIDPSTQRDPRWRIDSNRSGRRRTTPATPRHSRGCTTRTPCSRRGRAAASRGRRRSNFLEGRFRRRQAHDEAGTDRRVPGRRPGAPRRGIRGGRQGKGHQGSLRSALDAGRRRLAHPPRDVVAVASTGPIAATAWLIGPFPFQPAVPRRALSLRRLG